jgi:hypothetical protein
MDSEHSPGNNHSPYDPRSNASVPRPNTLLPTDYAFELTKEFRATFSKQGYVALPSSYQLAYWKKHVGDAAWEKECTQVDDANKKTIAEYEQQVAQIADQNRLRSDSNRLVMKQHEQKVAAYQRDLAAYPKREEKLIRIRESEAVRLRNEELERVIDSQAGFVAAAIEDAWRIAGEEWKLGPIRFVNPLIALGLLTLPSVIGPCLCAWFALIVLKVSSVNLRRDLAIILTHYTTLRYQEAILRPRYRFFLCSVNHTDAPQRKVYSPTDVEHTLLLLSEDKKWWLMNKHSTEEPSPFGSFRPQDFRCPRTLKGTVLIRLARLVLWLIPGISLWMAYTARKRMLAILREVFLQKVSLTEIQLRRKNSLAATLQKNLLMPRDRAILVEQYKAKLLILSPQPPQAPAEPILQPLAAVPLCPKLRTPQEIEPPSWCFDTSVRDNTEFVFKGSQVYEIEQVTPLARTLLFADNRVRPHFSFGGVPFAIAGNAPHMLLVGTTGSGKTTLNLRLLSSMLPLSKSQAQRLADKISQEGANYPSSSHQWARSRTHQAVVYNAKGEYLKYLEAFGFDSNVDLFNLDPADPHGYAWDIASDIDNRGRIEKFSEQLIPMSLAASQDKQVEFWCGTARTVVEALIVSFVNAARKAGREPSWTLRDLVMAAASEDSIRHVLQWHDTPYCKIQEIFGLANQQSSSIMMTLRQCMKPFVLVGNRWHDAMKRGRAISLKKWSREGANSVLVLPNTRDNVSAYSPLNNSIVKALTNLWLDERNSFCRDAEGRKHKLLRHMIIDEFGHAGRLDDLDRLMGEGRSFGVNCILGLHQLSQARETYGKDKLQTIIGMCSYMACLKSNDIETQKWMSEVIGNCLRSYEKASFSYSTSQGQTITASSTKTEGKSTGTNASSNSSRTAGTSDTFGESKSYSHSTQASRTSQLGQRGSTTTGTTDTASASSSSSRTLNESATEGTAFGISTQQSHGTSTGTSEAKNNSATEGRSVTRELRGEAAIEAHEFRQFPDPETTGKCEVVCVTPTLPVFRTTLQMAQLEPEYEFPEKLHRESVYRDPAEDEAASRSREWTDHDLQRLCIDSPTDELSSPAISGGGGTTLLSPPHDIEGPDGAPNTPSDTETPSDEESDDERPPQAEFDF